MQIVRTNVSELEDEDGVAEIAKLLTKLVDEVGLDEDDVRKALNQLLKEGLLYSPKPGYLKRTAD